MSNSFMYKGIALRIGRSATGFSTVPTCIASIKRN